MAGIQDSHLVFKGPSNEFIMKGLNQRRDHMQSTVLIGCIVMALELPPLNINVKEKKHRTPP